MIFSYEARPPQFVLIEGRNQEARNYVTVEALMIATHNFRRLTDCILAFHAEWQELSVCEQGCLEEILSLPTAADSTEPGR